MANIELSTILIEYARKFGCGLPLTPEQICNAVVLWVQENYGDGKSDLTPESLAEVISGSDTIVVDINEAGDKLEIHLDYEVINKLDRAILKPLSATYYDRIPVIPSGGTVPTYQPLQSVGGHFRHSLNGVGVPVMTAISIDSSPYETIQDFLTAYQDGRVLFIIPDVALTDTKNFPRFLGMVAGTGAWHSEPDVDLTFYFLASSGTITNMTFTYGATKEFRDVVTPI